MMSLACFGLHIAALTSSAPQDQFWLGIARLMGSGLLATVVGLAGLMVAHRLGH